MALDINRRDFLKFAGIGGVVFASGLGWPTRGFGVSANKSEMEDFYFVQLSDPHWGFTGPEANPDASGTLPKAVVAVNNYRDGSLYWDAGLHSLYRRSYPHNRRS